MTAITRILVPVDFSDHADRALEYALTLAKSFDARVELLHVVEDPFAAGGWASEVYMSDLDGMRRRALEDASKQLDACRAASLGEGVPVVATVRMGAVAQTIVEYATAEAASLIAMGTHGRTGLAHLILGSVAERVARTAPCPVLTVGTSEVTQNVHAAA